MNLWCWWVAGMEASGSVEKYGWYRSPGAWKSLSRNNLKSEEVHMDWVGYIWAKLIPLFADRLMDSWSLDTSDIVYCANWYLLPYQATSSLAKWCPSSSRHSHGSSTKPSGPPSAGQSGQDITTFSFVSLFCRNPSFYIILQTLYSWVPSGGQVLAYSILYTELWTGSAGCSSHDFLLSYLPARGWPPGFFWSLFPRETSVIRANVQSLLVPQVLVSKWE